jgi:hypothetical protein
MHFAISIVMVAGKARDDDCALHYQHFKNRAFSPQAVRFTIEQCPDTKVLLVFAAYVWVPGAKTTEPIAKKFGFS